MVANIKEYQEEFCALGFNSSHKAFAAEALLKKADIPCRLIPKPLELGGAECGLALRCYRKDHGKVDTLLEAAQIVYVNSFYYAEI